MNDHNKTREDGFFLAMDPPTVTHQMKRVACRSGKPVFYEDERLAKARDQLMAALAPHAPRSPLAGPVALRTVWCFPAGEHEDGSPHTQKPDTDNVQKLLKDCMTDLGFWRDDAQVFSDHIAKMWSEVPGIRIDYEGMQEWPGERRAR